jgi:hypothetical protein
MVQSFKGRRNCIYNFNSSITNTNCVGKEPLFVMKIMKKDTTRRLQSAGKRKRLWILKQVVHINANVL